MIKMEKNQETESTLEGFLQCGKDHWSTASVTTEDGEEHDLADWLARKVFNVDPDDADHEHGYTLGVFNPKALVKITVTHMRRTES